MGEEAEKSKGMKQREIPLESELHLQGRCLSWGGPNRPGELWGYRLFQ